MCTCKRSVDGSTEPVELPAWAQEQGTATVFTVLVNALFLQGPNNELCHFISELTQKVITLSSSTDIYDSWKAELL